MGGRAKHTIVKDERQAVILRVLTMACQIIGNAGSGWTFMIQDDCLALLSSATSM